MNFGEKVFYTLQINLTFIIMAYIIQLIGVALNWDLQGNGGCLFVLFIACRYSF